MPCCDARAIPRRSAAGTAHFYHRTRSGCDWKPESPEHIELKALVATLMTSYGWHAQTEVSGDGWRADVLARREDRAVAVEIQLSPQDAETTRARTARYRRDGLRCLWLMRDVPDGCRNDPAVSAFAVTISEHLPFMVEVANRRLSIDEFLRACVERRLRFVEPTVVPRAFVSAHERFVECGSCGHFFTLATGAFRRRCECGAEAWVADDPAAEAIVDAHIAGAAPTDRQTPLILASRAEPSADEDAWHRSVAAECPRCSASVKLSFPRRDGPGPAASEWWLELPEQALIAGQRHWCLGRETHC